MSFSLPRFRPKDWKRAHAPGRLVPVMTCKSASGLRVSFTVNHADDSGTGTVSSGHVAYGQRAGQRPGRAATGPGSGDDG